MKIVAACDSFKGSLTSAEAGRSAALGAGRAGAQAVHVPIGDGGEGTVAALVAAMGARTVSCNAVDALNRPICAEYAISEKAAVIEVAAAIGLPRLSAGERNPWVTTSRGVGMMIADALARGCRRITVALGGSATNDAGMGALVSLGFVFRDARGNVLCGCGGALAQVETVDASGVNPLLADAELMLCCDVRNAAYGPEGCAVVFAPQKGADAAMVRALDSGMRNFAEKVGDEFFRRPGSGAAGAIGATLCALCGARMVDGADMVLDACGFDSLIKDADLIITGEGRIDAQTLMGKAPAAVLARGLRAGVPVVAVAGQVSDRQRLLDAGFADVLRTADPGQPLAVSMCAQVAMRGIEEAVFRFLHKSMPDV